jgi:hypothetical protein
VGPQAAELDGFVLEIDENGAEVWSQSVIGPGPQQLSQVVVSGAKVFTAGTVSQDGGPSTDGIVQRLSAAGLNEKTSTVASPANDTFSASRPQEARRAACSPPDRSAEHRKCPTAPARPSATPTTSSS